jgi:hypothetical protein
MTSRKTSTTFAIWIRALFYLLVVAGGWLVVLPMLILFLEQCHLAVRLREMPWPFIGANFFISGTLLGLVSGYYLVTRGRGTPLPLDPTQELVTGGPYKRLLWCLQLQVRLLVFNRGRYGYCCSLL